jgi:hypothetical protein
MKLKSRSLSESVPWHRVRPWMSWPGISKVSQSIKMEEARTHTTTPGTTFHHRGLAITYMEIVEVSKE